MANNSQRRVIYRWPTTNRSQYDSCQYSYPTTRLSDSQYVWRLRGKILLLGKIEGADKERWRTRSPKGLRKGEESAQMSGLRHVKEEAWGKPMAGIKTDLPWAHAQKPEHTPQLSRQSGICDPHSLPGQLLHWEQHQGFTPDSHQ